MCYLHRWRSGERRGGEEISITYIRVREKYVVVCLRQDINCLRDNVKQIAYSVAEVYTNVNKHAR